jgi:hypothetical protein
VQGDPDLTERMAANLIDNAIRYNLPGGSVEVRTETQYGHALLTVANTGSPVPAAPSPRGSVLSVEPSCDRSGCRSSLGVADRPPVRERDDSSSSGARCMLAW